MSTLKGTLHMMGDLGKSQLSSLLETVPGLAGVLRNPVADAIVNMVRAGAGLHDFDIHEAEELVQYATRRGLIPSAEGAQLLDEVKVGSGRGSAKTKGPQKPAAKKPEAKKPVTGKPDAKKVSVKKAKAKSPGAKKKSAKKTSGRASKGRR
jgi:hypothetical protein